MRWYSAALLLALLSQTAGAQATWWNRAWPYRYPVYIKTPGYKCDAVAVDFLHAGRALEEAGDMRVADAAGNVLPHLVLQAGPGDFVRIAFKSAAAGQTCYLYLGNKRAGPPSYNWFPQGGLLLETRAYRGGDPGSLAAMREIVKRSGPQFGKAFVKNVFHGNNLFGPDENYVSIYTGTLEAPTTGRYTFCTSSDDASFLLVDERPVVAWPGWHGAVADTRHSAAVELRAGAHRFEYLHVNGGGPGITVAAWQPPGAARIWPIDARDFGWPAVAEIGRLEATSGMPLDFQAEVLDEHEYAAGRFVVKMLFRENSSRERKDCTWEFGDGLTGGGTAPVHVFLAEGEYTVTLKSGASQASNRIRIERRWWKALGGYNTNAADFVGTVRSYDFNALASSALASAFEFLKSADTEAALRLATAAVGRMEQLDAQTAASMAIYYTDVLRSRDAQAAVAVLTAAEKAAEKEPAALANVLLAKGDVLYYFLRDSKAALEVYDRIVSRFAGRLKEHTVRIGKMRIGDIYRGEGNYEAALAAYSAAEKFKLYSWPEDRLAVRKGALYAQAEQALKDGDAEAAAEALDVLEWEFPAERLRGESSLLRGRLALKRKDYHEAYKQFMELVNVNPGSHYAADCLHAAALALQALGKQAEADALRKRLAAEYPESPHAR